MKDNYRKQKYLTRVWSLVTNRTVRTEPGGIRLGNGAETVAQLSFSVREIRQAGKMQMQIGSVDKIEVQYSWASAGLCACVFHLVRACSSIV